MDQEEIKNCDIRLIGVKLDGGFNYTSELHVMKYEEAINRTNRKL